MNRGRSAVVVGVAATLAIALLVKRDCAQQERLERLTREVASLRAETSARQEERSPRPSPAGQGFCTVDSTSIEAIATRLASLTPRVGAAPVGSVHEQAPDPQREIAVERAGSVLDDAVRRGHLTRDDVLEMRKDLAENPEDGREISQRISVAVNMNRLVLDDPMFSTP